MSDFLPNNLESIKPQMPNSILPGGKNTEAQKTGKSFAETLSDSIEEINQMQQSANTQVEKLARGEIKDVHQVMIATQEASIAFSAMMKIRNKIVDAYQQISKMS